MIWLLTFCSKFLNIHAKKTNFYPFDFLEQQNNLKERKVMLLVGQIKITIKKGNSLHESNRMKIDQSLFLIYNLLNRFTFEI